MTVEAVSAEGGAVLRAVLDNGRGNVVDGATLRALHALLARAAKTQGLRAVVLEAKGPDFSLGASVEEHRPAQAPAMLRSLHAVLEQLLELPVPALAAVRGRCLGGGLELVLAASRVFAHPGARLGCPEVKLGVIAPAASVLLPRRVGEAAAEELLVTGRAVDAAEALELGLVDALCAEGEDPADAALGWVRAHLLGLSLTASRLATRAARTWARRARRRLAVLERFYAAEVMRTPDAIEGIEAFLARRPPKWSG